MAAKAKAPSVEVISDRYWNAGQSWHYERIIKTATGQKLKVYIRRNAYMDQSQASGYALDAASPKWNLLVDIPIQLCNCKGASYVRTSEPKAPFMADADFIIKELLAILS